MDDQVFRDPSVKNQGRDNPEAFRVMFQDKLCSPAFNSKGSAAAYLQQLQNGREPEFVQTV